MHPHEIATGRKSTRSGTNGACVEVGGTARVVLVRDTKDRGAAPAQARPLAAQATAVVSMAPAGSRRPHCSRSAARRSGVRDAT